MSACTLASLSVRRLGIYTDHGVETYPHHPRHNNVDSSGWVSFIDYHILVVVTDQFGLIL